MLWFYASNRSDHLTLGPLKILGPFAQRTCEIKDATVKQIALWTFSAAECEHDRKKSCDCNGDDNEAYTDEYARDCMLCVCEAQNGAHGCRFYWRFFIGQFLAYVLTLLK
jgi:uncharacterized protein YgiB involved in biofilm formation